MKKKTDEQPTKVRHVVTVTLTEKENRMLDELSEHGYTLEAGGYDGPHRPYKRATVAATALQHGMVKILELRKANLERKVKELRGEEKYAMEAWIKRIDGLIRPTGPLYQAAARG
jgi:hypothetical protein